jgi:hypothetical protein
MAILDFLISLAFCLGGIFYIWHTSKALRTGVFIGWQQPMSIMFIALNTPGNSILTF